VLTTRTEMSPRTTLIRSSLGYFPYYATIQFVHSVLLSRNFIPAQTHEGRSEHGTTIVVCRQRTVINTECIGRYSTVAIVDDNYILHEQHCVYSFRRTAVWWAVSVSVAFDPQPAYRQPPTTDNAGC